MKEKRNIVQKKPLFATQLALLGIIIIAIVITVIVTQYRQQYSQIAAALTPSPNPSCIPTQTPALISPTDTPSPFPTLPPGISPTPTPTLAPGVSPSPTPTLPPGVTPTDTPFPSVTGIPSLSPTANPTIPPTLGPPVGSLHVHFEGIDQSNNSKPNHQQRRVMLSFYPTQDFAKPAAYVLTTIVSYAAGNTDGAFVNDAIDLSTVPKGNYYILVKSPEGSLQEALSVQQVPIFYGTIPLQPVSSTVLNLRLGDLNGDNQVDIADYNILVDCYKTKVATPLCKRHNITDVQKGLFADVNDNGSVDGIDYNILIRNFEQQGYGGVITTTSMLTPNSIVAFATSPCIGQTPAPTSIAGWNNQKAEFLARSVYLDPTTDDIRKLAGATSAQNAVALLFTPPAAADVTAYQNGVAQLIAAKGTYSSEALYDNTLYTYTLIHDPDRVKRKLYYLWENIFSVDAPLPTKSIVYDDVTVFHQMLYDNTYGNYIQLVNKMPTAYSMAQYLDLTISQIANPNENFARELMQLFLLGQYSPLDKAQTTPNYSDQDVNSLAYILTGYTADLSAHTITFTAAAHYPQPKPFLGSQYNDPQNVINYIVQTKQAQATQFLANKLLQYFVTDTPTDQDIMTVAQMIQTNNFEILPTIKQLFVSDIMYSHMQEDRYRTPLELVSTYYSSLFGRNSNSVIPSSGILADLNFTPYRPGSIFGRDGFNTNILFYSGSIMNRWIADTSVLLDNIPLTNIISVLSTLVPSYTTIQTPDAFILALESPLYLGRDLPQSVKDSLQSYLTTDTKGAPLSFNLSDSNYLKAKIPGLLNLLLTQPEYMQISGTMLATPLPPQTSLQSAMPNLVIVRLKGGIDFQGVTAHITDPAYSANRGNMALTAATSTLLGNGYVLNNAANMLLPLVTSKEAFFVSAVGFPNHSRAHDIASTEMETGENSTGILAQLNKAVPTTRMVSLTSTAPVMMQGMSGLQIGGTGLVLYPQTNPPVADLTDRRNTLGKILNARQFPMQLAVFYAQALQLDALGNNKSINIGSGGNTNKSQFALIDQLIPQNVANVFYTVGDGGYDHHAHEDTQLNGELTNLYTNIVNFYNTEKTKTKISIIVFSEFGRTNKISGSNGTDHGQGGGIIVLSNVVHWPTMTGTFSPSTDKSNWTTVQVDVRDVWSRLFKDMYSLALPTLFGRSTDLSTYPVAVP